jgi:hypothetical protein
VNRIRSIGRGVAAFVSVVAGAVRGALQFSKRPTPTTIKPMRHSTGAAGAVRQPDVEQPVQPYPEEIQVDGRVIELPQPSFWPMVLAFGVTFLFFGLVTSVAISVAGAIVLAWAIAGWIGELRHD